MVSSLNRIRGPISWVRDFALPSGAAPGLHGFSMNPSEYLSTLFSLTGKVAVVIGGTGELCGAMAEALAGAGAEVVLVGRNEEKAKARLEKIHSAGGQAYFL